MPGISSVGKECHLPSCKDQFHKITFFDMCVRHTLDALSAEIAWKIKTIRSGKNLWRLLSFECFVLHAEVRKKHKLTLMPVRLSCIELSTHPTTLIVYIKHVSCKIYR
jgi:hypothetical protein